MKSLNFGASVAPRMTQAASHSHVSRVEMSNCSWSGEENGIVVCVVSAAVLFSGNGYAPTESTSNESNIDSFLCVAA